jgi:hypothetical protein
MGEVTAEHMEVFCKSGIVSSNDELLDYVALHPATILLKLNATANFMGRDSSPSSSPKTASLVGSIDQGWSIESCRARTASQDDPLAVKMAEGMRSTSARGVFFGLPFLHEQKR